MGNKRAGCWKIGAEGIIMNRRTQILVHIITVHSKLEFHALVYKIKVLEIIFIFRVLLRS